MILFIRALMLSSYSALPISPVLSFFLRALTSAVCGNDPMVVVGSTGKPNLAFWILSLSAKAGLLLKSSSLREATACLTASFLFTRSEAKSSLFAERALSDPSAPDATAAISAIS